MSIATHLIKIKGTFDKNIWGYDVEKLNEILKEFVKTKIKFEIDSYYHADLELFIIDDNKIDVWVFISALPSCVSKNIIGKWLKDHINKEGITVSDFEIEERNYSSANNFFVVLQ